MLPLLPLIRLMVRFLYRAACAPPSPLLLLLAAESSPLDPAGRVACRLTRVETALFRLRDDDADPAATIAATVGLRDCATADAEDADGCPNDLWYAAVLGLAEAASAAKASWRAASNRLIRLAVDVFDLL